MTGGGVEMLKLAAKMHGKLRVYLYLCRAEISAVVAPKGSVCPFFATE